MTSVINFLGYFKIHPENIEKSKSMIEIKQNEPVFLFDIDDTLYKMSQEMEKFEMATWKKVFDDLIKKNPIDSDFTTLLRKSPMFGGALYETFDITALEAETRRGYFDFGQYILVNERLRDVLLNLPYQKWCFTNGLKARAEAILKCLDIEDCFHGVVCIDDSEKGKTGKPFDFAYEFVINILNLKDNENVYFFDDSEKNIRKAKEYNWNCYLINRETDIVDSIISANQIAQFKADR